VAAIRNIPGSWAEITGLRDVCNSGMLVGWRCHWEPPHLKSAKVKSINRSKSKSPNQSWKSSGSSQFLNDGQQQSDGDCIIQLV
jgi:hypothetical protein